jgi:ribosomal protein L11
MTVQAVFLETPLRDLCLSVVPPQPSGVTSGSGKPNKDLVGKVTRAQVAEIAKKKLPDTNATKVGLWTYH